MKGTVRKSSFFLIKQWLMVFFVGCLLFFLTGCGEREVLNWQEGTFTITDMEVDAVKSPIGMDNEKPVFSWKFATDKPEFSQKSYELFVYRRDKLTEETELVWDSGIRKSDKTFSIVYDGKPLEEHSIYEWRVAVTDSENNRVCSDKETFSTAYWKENTFQHSSFISMNPDENVYEDGQAILRRTFLIPNKKVREAVLYATALGIYDGYVNGKRIGNVNPETKKREYDELKPGWSDYEDRLFYHTYEITDYLVENEENTMAFMLGTGWWCGRVSQGTYGYHVPALLGELHILYEDGTSEIIGTDASWEYYKDTAVVSGDIYNGEVYDARKLTTAEASLTKAQVCNGKPVYLPEGEQLGFDGEFQSNYGSFVRELAQYDRLPQSVMAYEGTVSDNSTFGTVKEVPVAFCEKSQGNFTFRGMKDGEKTVSGQELTGVEKKGSILLKQGQTLVLDFGQNMTAVPYFQYSTEEGAEISLHFAEMLNDSGEEKRGDDGPVGSLYQANYRSAVSAVKLIAGTDAIEEYQTVFSYFGFRYASITASADVEILNLKAVVIGNASPECGMLLTDNEKLNRLIENVKWSQRSNFLSVATDCPQRDERLGWTGDLQVFQKTSMFNQDLRYFYQMLLTDLRDSQRENGAYTDTVPYSVVTGSGNAGWADAGISIPYYLYKQYGDTVYIEEMYDSMSRYMEYLESISNLEAGSGRVGPLTAYGDWLAWEETDKEFVSAVYYAQDASRMAEMAEITGRKVDKRKYEKLYNKIKTYFNKTYVIDERLTVTTQTACLLAISGGLLDGQARENAVQLLVADVEKHDNCLTTGFLGTKELLFVLAEEGYADIAYELLLKEENPSWLYSVNQGATTIWERWDSYTKEEGFHKDGMNSFNHFNNGSVGEFLYEVLLGISVDAGEGVIRIHPQIPKETTAIHVCRGYYNSIYGRVEVAWRIAEGTLVYDLTIPPNASAIVTLPAEDGGEKEECLKAGTYSFRVELSVLR